MKKMENLLYRCISCIALFAAITSVCSASWATAYQPVAPDSLKSLKK